METEVKVKHFMFRRAENEVGGVKSQVNLTKDFVRVGGFELSFGESFDCRTIQFSAGGKALLTSYGWQIEIGPDSISVSTDWLGLNTIFYDAVSGCGGNHHNALGQLSEIDLVGLDLYLRYGYCCLGRTPFKNVYFLQATERILLREGKVNQYSRKDPLIDYVNRIHSSEEEIIFLIRDWFRKVHGQDESPIIIPLTAGYDSRLLTSICRDVFPSREIFSPTFSVAAIAGWSYEVVVARRVSQLLSTRHQAIPLDLKEWNKKINQWIDYRGFSSHAHGMHLIEFYERIHKITNFRKNISGIYGDVWAGMYDPKRFASANNDFDPYFNPHRNTYNKQLNLKESRELVADSIAKVTNELPECVAHTVLMARNKIPLINYLWGIPEDLGFSTSSPYVDPEIAVAMMLMPTALRTNRKWQTDYFQRNRLAVRVPLNPIARSNVSFAMACVNTEFEQVDESLFEGLLQKPSYATDGVMGKLRLIIDIITEYVSATLKLGVIFPACKEKLSPIFDRMVKYYCLMPIIRVKELTSK